MTTAVAAFGLFVLALGVMGVVRPDALMSFVERPWRTRAGLGLAFAFRAVFGVVLVAAATETRFPWVVGGLGVLSLVSAALVPVLGFVRIRRFIDWWLARPAGFIRAWALVACAFGGFLIYAVV